MAGDLGWAHAFSIIWTSSMGGKTGPGCAWAGAYDSESTVPTRVYRRLGPRLSSLAARLIDVQLECRDGAALIARRSGDEDAVWYVDPPYPGTTGYAAEVDQAALDEALLAVEGRCAVSGHPGDRPSLESAGWARHEFPVVRSVSTGTRSRPGATECLWLNYDPPLRHEQETLW